jgi:hypothetical protein
MSAAMRRQQSARSCRPRAEATEIAKGQRELIGEARGAIKRMERESDDREKRLQNLATAYLPTLRTTIERSRMAAELLAARRGGRGGAMNEDARERCQCGRRAASTRRQDAALDAALAAYDEATS